MAIAPNHLRYRDFINLLDAAVDSDTVCANPAMADRDKSRLREARANLEKAADEYRETVQRIFSEWKDTLRPLMRPCHQKRFDSLEVSICIEVS